MRAGVAVAWLTIDDDDNPVWFLAHLLESIRRVHPGVAESLDHVLEEHGDDGSRYLLTSIIDALHDVDEPTTLIVDDWQRVSDSQTIAALSFLLEHGCHHLQIIVTSWSRTGLPLSRLRLADELVEIDSAALRFDSGEATPFFDSLGGLSLTGNDVAALTESTDGWAAGLQLAGLSVRGGADASTLVGKLCGTSEVIGEFLAENVLASLEPEIVDFVLATSIPERICADLASALAQVPRGQALLEQVAQRGLFLQLVDGEPGWFHYHQMFAEFLRRRLERDDPQRVAQLHRTAALWLKEHDRLHDAVKHALAAGDPALAVDFVEDDETNLLEQSKMTTLLEIVKKLPPRLIVSRERLQLAIVWANILLQRKVPADAALNLFTKALDHADPATQADLRVEADVLQAVADTFADHRPGGHACRRGTLEAANVSSAGARGRRKRIGVRRALPVPVRPSAPPLGVGNTLPRDDGPVRQRLRAVLSGLGRQVCARYCDRGRRVPASRGDRTELRNELQRDADRRRLPR